MSALPILQRWLDPAYSGHIRSYNLWSPHTLEFMSEERMSQENAPIPGQWLSRTDPVTPDEDSESPYVPPNHTPRQRGLGPQAHALNDISTYASAMDVIDNPNQFRDSQISDTQALEEGIHQSETIRPPPVLSKSAVCRTLTNYSTFFEGRNEEKVDAEAFNHLSELEMETLAKIDPPPPIATAHRMGMEAQAGVYT